MSRTRSRPSQTSCLPSPVRPERSWDLTARHPLGVTAAGSGTVTTTGNPSSGNLAFFSGSGAITNGNLSGDCTTSGTGITACLKTGGVSFGPLCDHRHHECRHYQLRDASNRSPSGSDGRRDHDRQERTRPPWRRSMALL